MFATSRTQRRSPLLRFRSHFPDIRVSPPFSRPTVRPLLRDFGDPIDRLSSSSLSDRQAAEEDIACPLVSEKGLILNIPRARTRQVRVTRLGDNRDDNREHEGEKSPVQDQSSFSNPPDRMLYPRGDSLVGVCGEVTEKGGGKGGVRKANEAERAKKDSLIRGRFDPGPRFPRDSFASRNSLVFKPERAARSRP